MSETSPQTRRPAHTAPRPTHPPEGRTDVITIREVPRPDGRPRQIAVLPEIDGRSYEVSVARVLPLVERALGPEVFADRAWVRGRHIDLHDWRSARRRLRRATARSLRAAPAGLTLAMDVRECFASIEPGCVGSALRLIGARERHIERIVDHLRSFEERGVDGLPIGPVASTVLANAVLLQVDRAIQETGLRHMRWVDDLTVFVPDAASGERTCAQVRRALRQLGLRANEDKTRVVPNRSEVFRLVEASSAAGTRHVP